MKISIRILVIVIVGTLVGGLLLGWAFFGGSSELEHSHTEVINGETVWTCSMHPQIHQNEPGACPICGMDLIPLEDGNSEGIDPMAITMSPTAMQLANVVTAVVGSESATKAIRLNGKVQEDERLIYSQTAHFPGRIEKLSVNFTGEYVAKGSAIASLYSPQLVTAQEELFEAYKIKESHPGLYRAAKEKLKNWKLSETQIDQILASGQVKDQFPILADQSGYVIKKKVNLGDYVNRGQTLYEIANLSRVWVQFDVYENDLTWVNKGDSIQFTISSLSGQRFNGIIDYLDPVINPKTRVAKARVVVKNSDQRLKPEMFASGEVKSKVAKSGSQLTVPKSAVMWTGKRSVVYVKLSTDQGLHFKMREVTLGPALGDAFVIENGLESGEEIAVNGTFSIDAAAQLAGKPSMMSPEGGAAMTGHNHGSLSGEQGEMVMSVSSSQVTKKETKPVAISQEAKEKLKPLYTEYLRFKDALTADEFDQAQKAASDLKVQLDRVNMSVFTDESHNLWMSFSSDLKSTLQHVQHLKTIAELRNTFQQVSESMIAMTRAFNPIDQTLYVQFCPMADDNNGANWLSLEEEIANPYFGQSMLTCGEIKEKIE